MALEILLNVFATGTTHRNLSNCWTCRRLPVCMILTPDQNENYWKLIRLKSNLNVHISLRFEHAALTSLSRQPRL